MHNPFCYKMSKCYKIQNISVATGRPRQISGVNRVGPRRRAWRLRKALRPLGSHLANTAGVGPAPVLFGARSVISPTLQRKTAARAMSSTGDIFQKRMSMDFM